MTCPTCGGTGKINVGRQCMGGYTGVSDRKTCPTCGGSGKVSDNYMEDNEYQSQED